MCGSSGDQRTPTSQVCRAGGYESIRQRNFYHIDREDDKTCSHPSHSRKYNHGHLPNCTRYKLAEAVLCINLGQVAATRVAMKPQRLIKAGLNSRKHRGMFLYYKYLILMLLYFWKAGENKIFHFIYFCFFVSSHDFELLKLFILV